MFTRAPELKVLHGRTELGTVAPTTLTLRPPTGQPLVLSLSGRAWRVTHTNWRRRTVHVAPAEGRGRSRWGRGTGGIGAELAQSMRAVLLGEEPGGSLSRRGDAALSRLRDERAMTVSPNGTVLAQSPESAQWWTYAGDRANTSLRCALTAAGVAATSDSLSITIGSPPDPAALRTLVAAGLGQPPDVDPDAIQGLKFNTALPQPLAVAEVAERSTDPDAARRVLDGRITSVVT